MDGGVGHNKGGNERQYSTFDLWDVLTCDVPRWSPEGHKGFCATNLKGLQRLRLMPVSARDQSAGCDSPQVR